ncbi:MAG: hypothetical protein LAP87_18865, partial [Acidobacteriia bacterium]|nr:hypothetical protein [Terriglobia bacterium]
GERGGQGKKGIPKGKKPQVSFPLGYSNEMSRLALGCVWFGQSKLQIFLASIYRLALLKAKRLAVANIEFIAVHTVKKCRLKWPTRRIPAQSPIFFCRSIPKFVWIPPI